MKVQATYASTNPTCDILNLYCRSTLIARIHDQLWIEEVFGPQQRKRWYNGECIFLRFHRRRLMNTYDTRGKASVYDHE